MKRGKQFKALKNSPILFKTGNNLHQPTALIALICDKQSVSTIVLRRDASVEQSTPV